MVKRLSYIFSAALPLTDCRRVALVNPTGFLGNLLLAGGLVQEFIAFCRHREIEVLVVLDESFRELLGPALEPAELLFYPRRRIRQSRPLGQARAYLSCLRRLRAFAADLAFNIEEDTVAHRLTQLSGARFRLGCDPRRHRFGYERVLPVAFTHRPPGRDHRWHAYFELFQALGMPEPEPAYLRLPPRAMQTALRGRLERAGVDFTRPLVILHAGATKDYKKWPVAHFAALARSLEEAGFQPVLIGAGAGDREANMAIKDVLGAPVPDLANALSLAELAAFLPHGAAMVGNDSGPFHLAAALGLPGVVLFGPSEVSLWRPLSPRAIVLSGKAACAPDCSRHHCAWGRRCLQSLTPDRVMSEISKITKR